MQTKLSLRFTFNLCSKSRSHLLCSFPWYLLKRRRTFSAHGSVIPANCQQTNALQRRAERYKAEASLCWPYLDILYPQLHLIRSIWRLCMCRSRSGAYRPLPALVCQRGPMPFTLPEHVCSPTDGDQLTLLAESQRLTGQQPSKRKCSHTHKHTLVFS